MSYVGYQCNIQYNTLYYTQTVRVNLNETLNMKTTNEQDSNLISYILNAYLCNGFAVIIGLLLQ